MNTREELLQGLYYVRNQVNQIFNVYEQQRRIVASYRSKKSNISTNGAKNTSKIIIGIILVAVLGMFLLTALVSGNYTNLEISIVAIVILYVKRNEKSNLKIVAYGILILLTGSLFYSTIVNGYYIDMIIMASFAIVALIAILFLVREKNKKIDEHNIEVDVNNTHMQIQYNQTVQQLEVYKKELFQKTGAWYPRAYYTQDAINFFINAVENYRADTVKEMVNLYEKSEHYRRMEASQSAIMRNQQRMLEAQERMLAGQQEELQQLKFANALNIANFVMNMRAVDSIDRNTEAINSLKRY